MTREQLAISLRAIEPRWNDDVAPGRFGRVADHIETRVSLSEDLTNFLSCVRHYTGSDTHRDLASQAYYLRRGA